VNGRRKSKRLAETVSHEYAAAISMLEAGFSGDERDYCCAAEDFRRHPPLACDLMGSPRSVGYTGSRQAVPGYTSVQAAAR